MNNSDHRVTPAIGILIALSLCIQSASAQPASAQPASAQGEVVPIAEQARVVFKKRCASCHSQSQARGGLDMTSLEGILAGSNSGAVVEPGKPEESLVYTLSAHQDTPKMPPNAPKIPQRELNAIASWIKSLPSVESTVAAPTTMKSRDDGEDLKHAATLDQDSTLEQGLVSIDPMTGPLAITALAASKSFVAVSSHRQVALLDATTHQWLGGLNFPEGDVFALRFTSDGSRLIAAGGLGGQSGKVVCWDSVSYRRVASLSIEDDVVLAMDVSPDGKTVAVGGPKRTIEVIDLMSGQRKHVLRKHADWVTELAFSGDGVFLASADRFGSIYLWDVHSGMPFDTASSHTGAVTALQFSRDSNLLWSAGKDGQVQAWDLQRNQINARWTVSESGIADMLLHSDRVTTIDNQQHLASYSLSGKPIAQKAFEADLTTIVGLQSDGQSIVGDMRCGLHCLQSSMDGEVLVTYLPRKTQLLKAHRFSPPPVERQLKVTPSDEVVVKESLSRDDTMAEARRAIGASREAIDKTKQSMSELEARILDLQNALERLKGK